jgi:hypothetical protein
MHLIDLQSKTKAKEGTIEHYWFENEHIGLKNTLFHRITIPLEPFDSGLDYVEQPEDTLLIIEWINLGLKDPSLLAGVEITSEATEDVEASVYIGAAHNWTDIHSLRLKELAPNKYEIRGKVTVEFENEMVAKNEDFEFTTTAVYTGEAA